MDKQTAFQFKPRSTVRLDILVAMAVCLVPILVVGYLFVNVQLAETRGPYHITTDVADIDGDGDLDVIQANTRYEEVDTSFAGITWWINQGGGKFTSANPEMGGFSAAAGDVDGDGDPDLLVLDGYDLTLFLNQGGVQAGQSGEFKVHNPITPLNDWHGHMDMRGSVVLGDLNNDGQIDGFVAGCCYLSVQQRPGEMERIPSSSWVWINEWDPRGWLVRHTLNLTALDEVPVRAAALGDLDGDGDLDVFAAVGTPKPDGAGSLADRVLLNDGLGNLSDSGQRLSPEGTTSRPGAANSTSVALGDLDGDGDLDALVGTAQGAILWINQGGIQGGQPGLFASTGQAPPVPPSGQLSRPLGGLPIASGEISAIFLQDFNRDGNLDALIAGVDQADIWWNDGHAAFSRSNQHFSYSERHGIAVADFNGDGYVDIFAGVYAETYRVWFNQGDGTFQAGPGK